MTLMDGFNGTVDIIEEDDLIQMKTILRKMLDKLADLMLWRDLLVHLLKGLKIQMENPT